MSDDEDLLIEADSILSLIRHREHAGLSQQSLQDLDALLAKLRPRTDQIITARRERSS